MEVIQTYKTKICNYGEHFCGFIKVASFSMKDGFDFQRKLYRVDWGWFADKHHGWQFQPASLAGRSCSNLSIYGLGCSSEIDTRHAHRRYAKIFGGNRKSCLQLHTIMYVELLTIGPWHLYFIYLTFQPISIIVSAELIKSILYFICSWFITIVFVVVSVSQRMIDRRLFY